MPNKDVLKFPIPNITVTDVDEKTHNLDLETFNSSSYNRNSNNKQLFQAKQENKNKFKKSDSGRERYYKLRQNFDKCYSEEELSHYLELFFSKREVMLQINNVFCGWFIHSNITREKLNNLPTVNGPNTKHRQILALLRHALNPTTSLFGGDKNRTFLIFESLKFIEGEPDDPRLGVNAPLAFKDMLEIVKEYNLMVARERECLKQNYKLSHGSSLYVAMGLRRW